MLEVLLILLLLLLIAKLFGEIAERLNQPSLIGELLAGVVFGPIFIIIANNFGYQPLAELTALASESDVFHALADLGIFFLMLLAGLEIRMNDLFKNWKSSLLTAGGGIVFPFALGYFIAAAFDFTILERLFIGVALSATAIAISVRTLMRIGKLRTKVGSTILGAAVIDDVISLFFLTLLLGFASSATFSTGIVSLQLLKIIFFIIIITLAHILFIPSIMKYSKKMKSEESLLSFSILIALVFAVFSELMGLHFVIGAFFAGITIGNTLTKKQIKRDISEISSIALGFLTPFFFISLGMSMNFSAFQNNILLAVVLLFAAFVGKIFGSFLGSFAAGLKPKNALQVGIGMNGRGAIDLVVIELGRRFGLVSGDVFSAILFVAFVATVLTPIMLKASFRTK